MNTFPSPEQALVFAELQMTRALRLLHTLRQDALHGTYDPVRFEAARDAYRQAEDDLRAARRAVAEAETSSTAAATTPATSARSRDFVDTRNAIDLPWPTAPAEPTSGLLFARYLVQTGRLTEWPASPPAEPAPRAQRPKPSRRKPTAAA